MLDAIKSVNWDDLRIKLWQLFLVLAAAYAVTDSRLAWAAPALTAAAGLSKPPLNGK